MNIHSIHLLLADDDKDDCMLFKEALEELPLNTNLTTVHDGEQLMIHLSKTIQLPSLLFLDINMPRKNGIECLVEIKNDTRLKSLPVVIFSTSFEPKIINQLYDNGAQHYIQKPPEFSKLKHLIYQALIITKKNKNQPPKKEFILQPQILDFDEH